MDKENKSKDDELENVDVEKKKVKRTRTLLSCWARDTKRDASVCVTFSLFNIQWLCKDCIISFNMCLCVVISTHVRTIYAPDELSDVKLFYEIHAQAHTYTMCRYIFSTVTANIIHPPRSPNQFICTISIPSPYSVWIEFPLLNLLLDRWRWYVEAAIWWVNLVMQQPCNVCQLIEWKPFFPHLRVVNLHRSTKREREREMHTHTSTHILNVNQFNCDSFLFTRNWWNFWGNLGGWRFSLTDSHSIIRRFMRFD